MWTCILRNLCTVHMRIVQNMFLHFLTNIICEVSRIVCKATDGISACLKQAWKTGSKVICKNLNRMSALNSAYGWTQDRTRCRDLELTLFVASYASIKTLPRFPPTVVKCRATSVAKIWLEWALSIRLGTGQDRRKETNWLEMFELHRAGWEGQSHPLQYLCNAHHHL